MGRLNHHEVDNGYVEVYLSYYPSEYTCAYVPYPDTILINYISDDKMDRLLELFHSELDDNILNADL